MNTVLITGGSGLIGGRLSDLLTQKGYSVRHLTRTVNPASKYESFKWHLNANYIDSKALINVDHIIHLAGTNVTDARWTNSRKQSILSSRIDAAKLLYNSLKNQTLKTYISASGISCYGAKTTDHIFKEDDQFGTDFLADVTRQWEKSAELFTNMADRVICLRTPVVLSSNGGAINKMAKPIKMGIGSALGSGKQFMPWIHIDDLCKLYIKSIEDSNMTGAYNAVASEHCTNAQLTTAIAKQLNKKLWAPKVPPFVLKLILGEMSEIILNGSRISNNKLINTGFRFQFPDLEKAIKNCISK